MPFGVANAAMPFVSCTEPFECKLSPRHPGYDMTVCACMVPRKVVIAIKHNESENLVDIMRASECDYSSSAKTHKRYQ